jgi:hypothetical protein
LPARRSPLKIGKQTIEDTGALTKKLMETIDELEQRARRSAKPHHD